MASIAGELERDLRLALSCGRRVYFSVGGDAGSGKTTTLYNLLKSLEYKASVVYQMCTMDDSASVAMSHSAHDRDHVLSSIPTTSPIKLTSINLPQCLEYQYKRMVKRIEGDDRSDCPVVFEGVFYADYYDISSFPRDWIRSTIDGLTEKYPSVGAKRGPMPIVLIIDDIHTLYQLFSVNGRGAVLQSFLVQWPGHIVFTTLDQDFVPYYLDPEKSHKDKEQECISPSDKHILVRYPLSFGGGIATITRRLLISHPLLARDNIYTTISNSLSNKDSSNSVHEHHDKVSKSCQYLALHIHRGITADELNHAIFYGREKLRSVEGYSLEDNKNVSTELSTLYKNDFVHRLKLFEEGFLAALQNSKRGTHVTTIVRYMPASLSSLMERLSLLISLHIWKHPSMDRCDVTDDTIRSVASSQCGNRSRTVTMGPVGMATKTTSGILVHGASGTGKTVMLKKLALEFPSIPFFFIPSHTLFGKYLGESEERLREVFVKTRADAPCVLVLEDIDVLAQKRIKGSEGDGGGMDVTKRMLAALLCELDGFEENTGVLVIGTTNTNPDSMDSALLRQGRLETLVAIPLLSYEDCVMIFAAFLDSLLDEICFKTNCDEGTRSFTGYTFQEAVNRLNVSTDTCRSPCLSGNKRSNEFDFEAAVHLLRIGATEEKAHNNNTKLVVTYLSSFYTGRPLCAAERAMRLLLEIIIDEVE